MRSTFRLQIIDPEGVLTNIDRHQIENMIWLRLAVHRDAIVQVTFAIRAIGHDQYGLEHHVRTFTRLASGYEIETCTGRISKGATLVAAMDNLELKVDRRIQFESGLMFWIQRWFDRVIGGLLPSIRISSRGFNRSAEHTMSGN